MDCTDIKALLSGLIDDEVDLDVRHAAERHLVACRQCRQIVDEAEALDELIEAHIEEAIDERGLPAGFEGAVLRRTVTAESTGGYFRHWTTWTGWLAAAAALVMAISIWVIDRRPLDGKGPRVLAPGHSNTEATVIEHAVYKTGDELRSQIYKGSVPPELEAGPTLSTADADTLYFASLMLGMLAECDHHSFEDIERVRAAIEYEDLLPQLARVRRGLAATDVPVLLAAESVFVRVARGPLSQDDIRVLREIVTDLHLADTIAAMSDRPPADRSA